MVAGSHGRKIESPAEVGLNRKSSIQHYRDIGCAQLAGIAVPVVVGVEINDAREFAGPTAGWTAQRREVQTGSPLVPNRQKCASLLYRRDQGRDRRSQRRNHGERSPGSGSAVIIGREY